MAEQMVTLRWPKWLDLEAVEASAERRLGRVSPTRWGWPVEYVLEYASEEARCLAAFVRLGDWVRLWEVLGDLNASGEFQSPEEASAWLDVVFGLVEPGPGFDGRFDA